MLLFVDEAQANLTVIPPVTVIGLIASNSFGSGRKVAKPSACSPENPMEAVAGFVTLCSTRRRVERYYYVYSKGPQTQCRRRPSVQSSVCLTACHSLTQRSMWTSIQSFPSARNPLHLLLPAKASERNERQEV